MYGAQTNLTIPIKVRNITTAKQKKATKAFACMSGCLTCNIFTINRPPIINMKAVSVRTRWRNETMVRRMNVLDELLNEHSRVRVVELL